jgi:hypothetical protein
MSKGKMKGRFLDLDNELHRLKKLFDFGQKLEVVWFPNSSSELSGEVKGATIYVYEDDMDAAIETLRHEFLDHIITRQLIHPLVSIINALIKQKESEIYRSKEELIARICEFLKERVVEE